MRAPFLALRHARAEDPAASAETTAQYCGAPSRAAARDALRLMRQTSTDGRVRSARERRRFPRVEHQGRVTRPAA